ncbi:hypothetical protein [Actibacterium sp. D379-3]
MGRVAAVLTGDLVGSTKAGAVAVDAAMATLSQGADTLSHWAGCETRFTRFRGDGWQIYLDVPGLALRACLYLTACLRADKAAPFTRIAAGIGAVPSVPIDRLDSAGGAAFELSGRALDAMTRGRLGLAAPGLPAEAAALFDLADALTRHWTAKQAAALMLALAPHAPSQSEMAARLGITQQAFALRVNGAGLWALDAAMALLEARDYD